MGTKRSALRTGHVTLLCVNSLDQNLFSWHRHAIPTEEVLIQGMQEQGGESQRDL